MRSRRRLERDGAGEDAAVDLGQHDVHREIGRREAARGGRPLRLASRGRQHDLQHRRVGLRRARSSPSSSRAEKAVVLRITSGGSPRDQRAQRRAMAGSLRLSRTAPSTREALRVAARRRARRSARCRRPAGRSGRTRSARAAPLGRRAASRQPPKHGDAGRLGRQRRPRQVRPARATQAQRLRDVVGAALAEDRPSSRSRSRRRQGRGGVEARVGRSSPGTTASATPSRGGARRVRSTP